MFDPKQLLDQFLGSQRPGAKGAGGLGSLGGLGSPGGMGGGAGGTLRDRADQVLQYAKNNPGKTSALAGILLGTKSGRSLGGSALKIGGLAAVAGLAYNAYQQYQASQAGQTAAGASPAAGAGASTEILPPPENTGFHPSSHPQGEDAFSLVLVRAMIAAAKADGHIDAQEREKIAGRLSEAELGAEAERFVNQELANPVDIDALVAAAKTEEQRVEIYTASRLAIDPETRAERGYLDHLAGRLQLPDALIDRIEQTVSAAKIAD
jgi:uncharacterized membrane protein YebE (DUF533 family)